MPRRRSYRDRQRTAGRDDHILGVAVGKAAQLSDGSIGEIGAVPDRYQPVFECMDDFGVGRRLPGSEGARSSWRNGVNTARRRIDLVRRWCPRVGASWIASRVVLARTGLESRDHSLRVPAIQRDRDHDRADHGDNRGQNQYPSSNLTSPTRAARRIEPLLSGRSPPASLARRLALSWLLLGIRCALPRHGGETTHCRSAMRDRMAAAGRPTTHRRTHCTRDGASGATSGRSPDVWPSPAPHRCRGGWWIVRRCLALARERDSPTS